MKQKSKLNRQTGDIFTSAVLLSELTEGFAYII